MATHAPIAALEALVDRLVEAPADAPFLSVYLDGRPNQHGRGQVQPFLGKELRSRRRTLGRHPRHRGAGAAGHPGRLPPA